MKAKSTITTVQGYTLNKNLHNGVCNCVKRGHIACPINFVVMATYLTRWRACPSCPSWSWEVCHWTLW